MTEQTSGPVATVHRYVDAFNCGDEDAMAVCFVNDGLIVDGVAPHIWSGPSASRRWYSDALVEWEHLGLNDFHMELGNPFHENTIGAAAYVGAPATLSFRVRGHPVVQSEALLTVGLRWIERRWLIAAWAWSKGGDVGDEASVRFAHA